MSGLGTSTTFFRHSRQLATRSIIESYYTNFGGISNSNSNNYIDFFKVID